MAKLLKLRRGTTSQHSSFTGAEGEVTVDTDKETLVVHDGSTAGGHPVAAEDMANVSSASIAGRLANDSIAVGKIAAGTLPSDVKIADANVSGNLTIATADINTGAVTTDKIAGGNVTTAKIADNAITSAKINAGAVATADIANDAVTFAKLQNVQQNHVVGRIGSGTADAQQLNASEIRTIINVENGATADQTKSDIDALNINADTVDSLHASSFLRSDADDTTTGRLAINRTSSDEKLSLEGTSNPYIRFKEGTTNKAYIQWNSSGFLQLSNDESNEHVRIKSGTNGLKFLEGSSEYTVWHAGNDGSGSGLDADNLDGRTWSTSAGNSTIVSRNGDGYIFGNYLNMTGTFATSGIGSGMGYFTGTNGSDNYGRTYTAAAARTLLNVENGATADQSASEIATALRGQTIGTSTDGVHNIYNDDWYRNIGSGYGMYNQSTGQHFYSDHDDYWNIAGGGTANALRFRDDNASTIRGYCYADSSNQIGFLNSSGSWSLKCDNSGNVTATGNVTAYSDARLKTNVNTINDALSICGKLRGVSFDWKESGKHSIGVIAQEVEAVLPELVVTQDVSTTEHPELKEVKSVDYGKIVGVLINAINELKAEVEELKGGK